MVVGGCGDRCERGGFVGVVAELQELGRPGAVGDRAATRKDAAQGYQFVDADPHGIRRGRCRRRTGNRPVVGTGPRLTRPPARLLQGLCGRLRRTRYLRAGSPSPLTGVDTTGAGRREQRRVPRRWLRGRTELWPLAEAAPRSIRVKDGRRTIG